MGVGVRVGVGVGLVDTLVQLLPVPVGTQPSEAMITRSTSIPACWPMSLTVWLPAVRLTLFEVLPCRLGP